MLAKATDATTTSVNLSTSDQQLIAASTTSARRGVALYYDAAAIAYIKLGSSAATTSNHTVKMGSGLLTYVELPWNYQGEVRVIGSAATGAVQVTEYR